MECIIDLFSHGLIILILVHTLRGEGVLVELRHRGLNWSICVGANFTALCLKGLFNFLLPGVAIGAIEAQCLCLLYSYLVWECRFISQDFLTFVFEVRVLAISEILFSWAHLDCLQDNFSFHQWESEIVLSCLQFTSDSCIFECHSLERTKYFYLFKMNIMIHSIISFPGSMHVKHIQLWMSDMSTLFWL